METHGSRRRAPVSAASEVLKLSDPGPDDVDANRAAGGLSLFLLVGAAMLGTTAAVFHSLAFLGAAIVGAMAGAVVLVWASLRER